MSTTLIFSLSPLHIQELHSLQHVTLQEIFHFSKSEGKDATAFCWHNLSFKKLDKTFTKVDRDLFLSYIISASLMLTRGSYSLTLTLKASSAGGGYKDQQNDWINAGQFWRSQSKSSQNWVLKIIGLSALGIR